jgi:hypothetical protein
VDYCGGNTVFLVWSVFVTKKKDGDKVSWNMKVFSIIAVLIVIGISR